MQARPLAPRPDAAAASLGRRGLQAWSSRLFDALPGRCLVCGLWQQRGLCRACQLRFASTPARCQRCALRLPAGQVCGACSLAPPAFAHAVALADYGFPWDRLIARLKFQDQPELAGPLAGLLAQAVRRHPTLPAVHAVLPVPLAPARWAERGYNQAWALAQQVAARLNLPAWPQVLERWRDTPHQVGAGRAQRLANLRNTMWVDGPHQGRVAGRQLALVDDVMTTGVTAEAAAQALLAAGAAGVQVWVLARTAAPGS